MVFGLKYSKEHQRKFQCQMSMKYQFHEKSFDQTTQITTFKYCVCEREGDSILFFSEITLKFLQVIMCFAIDYCQ